jgi:hypothetical protein
MIKHRRNLFQAENAICLLDTNRGGNPFMKAVKTHVGRCDTCGEPAAYAQLLPGGRTFRFCEQHAPLQVKKQAEATAALEKEKK